MIYRAVTDPNRPIDAAPTTPRAPSNVPFFVDNVWEWLRPQHMPSRRFAAFASPSPELAAASASLPVSNARRVVLSSGARACQIRGGDRPDDARYHSDIKALTRLVLRQQLPRAWFGQPARERWPEAVLFMPCASAEEVEAAVSASELLNAASLRDASRFWSDVEIVEPEASAIPHRTGEIFFEGPYELLP